MAAPAFSIREYVASMRGTAVPEVEPFLGLKALPPMPARRFRWWADELAVATAAAAPKKKPPVSDLFAAAAVAADEEEHGELDELLWAIKKRTKDKKKKKRRSEDDGAEKERFSKRFAARGSEEVENQHGMKITKVTPNKQQKSDPLNTLQTSNKPEGEKHVKVQDGNISDIRRMKSKSVRNLRKKHKLKYIQCIKAVKAQKPRDLAKMLPLHSLLKKYTNRTSVKMVKEKCTNSGEPEVIELCHKLVRRVTFSGVDDMVNSKKQSSKLPQLHSLCKLFSEALANSSSSTDMSIEGDKCIVADGSSAHKIEEASFENKQSDKCACHADSSESSSSKLPSGLIDLNHVPEESTDLNYSYISSSEAPNLEYANGATCDSDLLIPDNGREAVLEHRQDLPFNSQRVESELNTSDLERIRNSRSAGALLPDDVMNISGREIASLPLNSRGEFIKSHHDHQKISARHDRMKGKSACAALPNHAVQYSTQPPYNWCISLNQDGFSLFTGSEFPRCRCRECSLLPPDRSNFHSDMNVQHGQTMRLMGKDLTVCATRSYCLGDMTPKHAHPSTEDQLATHMILELPRQSQPFVSLQAQNFSNVSPNATSTSQASLGYRPHHFRNLNPNEDFFHGNRIVCQDRFIEFKNLHHGQNAASRFPYLPVHDSARFSQNSPAPWCHSDPFCRQHATPSSVYHFNLPQPHGLYSASSLDYPPEGMSMNFTYALKQPGQITRNVSDITSEAAISSRYTDKEMASSNISSIVMGMPRSGPVKLSAGAKHFLTPRENTVDDNSLSVYSCTPFSIASRGANISACQKKAA